MSIVWIFRLCSASICRWSAVRMLHRFRHCDTQAQKVRYSMMKRTVHHRNGLRNRWFLITVYVTLNVDELIRETFVFHVKMPTCIRYVPTRTCTRSWFWFYFVQEGEKLKCHSWRPRNTWRKWHNDVNASLLTSLAIHVPRTFYSKPIFWTIIAWNSRTVISP